MFIKFLVFVLGDFTARASPDRLHRVQRFVVGFSVLFLEADRMSDKIGVPLNNSRYHILVCEILHMIVFFKLPKPQCDGSSAREPVALGNRVCTVAGRFPTRRMSFSGTSSHKRYQIRRHECGIEADSEL